MESALLAHTESPVFDDPPSELPITASFVPRGGFSLASGQGTARENGVQNRAGPEVLDALGPLAELVADPAVTDVFVNGDAGVWVDRGKGLTSVPRVRASEADWRLLGTRLLELGGRHVDEANPAGDVRIGDGIRVHVVLPPVSVAGTLISIRVPRASIASLGRLEQAGMFSRVPRSLVDRLVSARLNVLITGAAGSGKTTLLAAMLSAAEVTERIVALEEVAELRVSHPHFVVLEARQPNLEGAGGVGLERLVREALRMRPDRLVVGECRGAELRELLAALNTGHEGGGGTLHANSLDDVPARLEALGALAGLSPAAVARQAASAIGVVLHLERTDRMRVLASVGSLRVDEYGRLEVVSRA